MSTTDPPDPDSVTIPRMVDECAAEPLPGAKIGRYIVIETLGRGGMGLVLRGYDPKLFREIALKQVLRERLQPDDEARLVREARAMAQLNHPNVVAVYDVDVSEDGVALAMELVVGTTLRLWLDVQPRSWSELRAIFGQAGRALGAAHAVGLVHRDFKPTNVMVSPTGLAKVTDFGLAKTSESIDIDGKPGDAPRSSSDGLETLTQDGAVVGTPRYMAPEQHEGRIAGGATDQFAFCAALWEAATGTPPFPGNRSSAIHAAKLIGPKRWPRPKGVPPHVGDALIRGMAAHPDSRWPSMAELLSEIERDPAARRRRVAVVSAATALVVGGGLAINISTGSIPSPCPSAVDGLEGVWDEARSAEVHAALESTKLSFAGSTWERTAADLDAFSTAWREGHRAACEATRVHFEQSAEAMDLRMACLADARVELRVAVNLLGEASPKTIEHAATLVSGLPDLTRCDDIARLRETVPPPRDPEVAVGVRNAVDQIAEVQAMFRAGQYKSAEKAIAGLVETAEALGYRPLLARTQSLSGRVMGKRGEVVVAEERLRSALTTALELNMRALAVDTASALAVQLATHSGRFDEAVSMGEIALALAIDDDDPRGLAATRHDYVNVLNAAGRYDQALRAARTSLEAAEPASAVRAEAYKALSEAARNAGRLNEAEDAGRRAVEAFVDLRGAEHPLTAGARVSLGNVLSLTNKLDLAGVEYVDALEVLERSLGPDDPRLAGTRSNYGQLLRRLGEFDAAEAQYRSALQTFERLYGPRSQVVGRARHNLGSCLWDRGDTEASETESRLAVEILEQTVDAGHPDLSRARSSLARALLARGALDDAHRETMLALQAAEKTWTSGGELAQTKRLYGEVLAAQGDDEGARQQLEQAITMFDPAADPRVIAEAQFALAKVLIRRPSDRGRALELANTALLALQGAGAEAYANTVAAWLGDQ